MDKDRYSPEAYAHKVAGNRKRNAEYRKRNPEKCRAQQRAYQQRVSAKVAEQGRRYRQTEEGQRRRRDYWLRKVYGISLDDFNEMFRLQGGVCAICAHPEIRKAPNGDIRALSVDHSHKTGMIRALLCHDCNSGIGLLGENGDRLRAAARYVEAFEKRADDGK